MNFLDFLFINNFLNGSNLRKDDFKKLLNGDSVNKSKISVIEGTNQIKAAEFALSIKNIVTVSDILNIHKILSNGIDDSSAGRLRSIDIKSGTSNSAQIESELHNLCDKLNEKWNEDTSEVVSCIHAKIIKIFPFMSCNEEVARFLCIPFILSSYKKLKFIDESKSFDYKMLCDNMGTEDKFKKLFDLVYFKKQTKKKMHKNRDTINLLKIGDVSFWSKQPTSKIRYWIQLGIISPEKTTNVQMTFTPNIIDKIKKILSLQKRGLSLREIKSKFSIGELC